MTAPAACPACGEPLAQKARACPECGSDHRTGWSRGTGHLLPESDELPERHASWKRVLSSLLVVVPVVLLTLAWPLAPELVTFTVGILAAAGLAFLAVHLVSRSSWSRTRQAWGALLRATRGDEGAARRLVDAELARHPEWTRERALRAAVERLVADRR